MKGFLIRGWEPILPGVRQLYVRVPANQQSPSGAGVSTPCGAVSTGDHRFRPQVVGVIYGWRDL